MLLKDRATPQIAPHWHWCARETDQHLHAHTYCAWTSKYPPKSQLARARLVRATCWAFSAASGHPGQRPEVATIQFPSGAPDCYNLLQYAMLNAADFPDPWQSHSKEGVCIR